MDDDAVLAQIVDLTRALDRPIAADDDALFLGRTVVQGEAIRMSILRLVAAGKLVAGDGYVRVKNG